jgi:hypothetical protein
MMGRDHFGLGLPIEHLSERFHAELLAMFVDDTTSVFSKVVLFCLDLREGPRVAQP